ncbi:MAG: hypothetical protein GF329_08810 [Candidatus Lokiarchaeota archaeon]|nr:hypothetical protein [Candidatus Lokiarchaeota archaeon]
MTRNRFFKPFKKKNKIFFMIIIIFTLSLGLILFPNMHLFFPNKLTQIISDSSEELMSSAHPQTENVIIICVEFSNRQSSQTNDSIMDKIIMMEDYYSEVSYGLKTVSGTLANPTSNDPDSDGWYDIGSYSTSYTSNSKPLISAAISAADSDIDFDLYPHIIIVCAGDDYAQSGNENDIHSHFASFQPPINTGGILERDVYNSCVLAETDPFSVFAHEFGHSQGLPDLYDIDDDGKNQIFVDEYSLMAEGSWNGNPAGSTPAGLMGFSRLNLSILDLSATVPNNTHSVVDLFSLSETNHSALIKINISHSCYYLLEYRKKVGTDTALPDQGVLITYINESKGTWWDGHVMYHENGPVILEDAQSSTSTLDDAPFDIGINEKSYFNDNINNVHISLLEKNDSAYVIDIDRTNMSTDLTPPTTEIRLDGWYSGNTLFMGSIKLNPYDYKSDINNTVYRINGGAWNEYNSSINLPFSFAPTTYSIEYRSSDLNGNIEPVKQVNITMNYTFVLLIIISIILAVVILVVYVIYRSTKGKNTKNRSGTGGSYSYTDAETSTVSSSSSGSSTSIYGTEYTKYCKYCNIEYPEDQNFCFNCGNKLERK